MSKKAKIATVKSSTQNQLDPSLSGQVVFPIHTSWPLYKGSIQPEKQDIRPVLQVDLSRLSTDWPQDLTTRPELGDNPKKDKREPDRKPPLIDDVSNEEKLNALFERLSKNAAEVDVVAEFLRHRDAASSFAQAAEAEPTSGSCPADAPPLWAERTTGREVSPVGWIRLHYGNKSPEPDNWDPLGLTREMLAEIDPHLARAYAKMISRDRECALPGLPPKDVLHIADPVLALARKKQQVQEASARYRKRKSSRHIA